jgi:uncharacterized phage-associated protein
MAFPAAAVANYFFDLAKRDEKLADFTPMKVLKLVYFAHGWNLGITGEPLIDEQIEAWDYGPVVRSLYSKLRDFGNQPVTEYIREIHFHDEGGFHWSFSHESMDAANLDPALITFSKKLVESTWHAYKDMTGVQLSNLTHIDGGPWKKTVDQYGGKPPNGTDIPTGMIIEYFKAQLRRNETALGNENVVRA